MNLPRIFTYRRGLNRLLSLFGRGALVIGLLIVGSNFSTGGENPNNFDTFQKTLGVANPADGSGVMVSGELWDSYQPANRGPYYSQASQAVPTVLVRVGNFDRAWSTPTHMWPGGWDRGAFWTKQIEATVWDPDPNFNPQTIGGASNPSYDGNPNYAYLAYPNRNQTGTIPGKGDPNRNYNRETKWVDAQKRHHALYVAGWPTTVGVDVKMRIHQYSLNWNNFNDFIIVEFTLTNTGIVDQNADGTPEITNHVIEGLAMSTHGEYMSSFSLSRTGGRGNRFGATRAIGYIADPDPSGAPWNMHISYPGESGAGAKDMGLFDYTQRWYADVWSAWTFLGAKDLAGADFPTRFGTHPIGEGAQRGWFTSDGVGKGFRVERNNSEQTFIGSTGTWYQDGGKSLDAGKFNLSANSNFFQAGSTPRDLRTFVPLASPGQLNGDTKTTNVFDVNTYEPGWTKGFTAANNFDGDGFMGIGPFKLDVGQSVVITWVTAGGFRLQGVANAIQAARWVYENKTNNDYDLPFEYPAVPEMRVDNTLQKSTRIRWDNRAETGPGFAGYKVWKANLGKRIDWLAGGMRGMDEYWRNTTPGETPPSLLKDINPNFGAQAFVAGAQGVPDSWGPYELVAVIPAAQLGTYADASVQGYNYSWEDPVVDIGFKYWYYVSAYTNQTIDLGTGYVPFPAGAKTNSPQTATVETSNINRNGASGLWEDTYPFADLNSFFPKTAAGEKAIGAGFIVKSALANTASLASGAAKISVKPNPYKKKALFDSAVDAFDHKITIYNLPPRATITILDVSGQIVDQIEFTSSDPNNGSTFWDMFSKDGVEVASGLYIYVVDYDGGQHVGYFSILR